MEDAGRGQFGRARLLCVHSFQPKSLSDNRAEACFPKRVLCTHLPDTDIVILRSATRNLLPHNTLRAIEGSSFGLLEPGRSDEEASDRRMRTAHGAEATFKPAERRSFGRAQAMVQQMIRRGAPSGKQPDSCRIEVSKQAEVGAPPIRPILVKPVRRPKNRVDVRPTPSDA